jgi:hypothetical protein
LALNAKLRNIRLTEGEISPSGFLFFSRTRRAAQYARG